MSATRMIEYRKDFPALSKRRNGRPPIYLDNACTTLVPDQVISALEEYYTDFPACAGKRSHHWFAEEVTNRIEGNSDLGIKGARKKIAEFIHATSEKEIVFTLNTTHAINTIALGFHFKKGDIVLLTDHEHNSNLLPWLRLQKTGLIQVDHIVTDPQSGFDLEIFEQHIKQKQVRLVSMAWTSNVTGATLPATQIIEIAHRYGAYVLLDGAQTVPHQPVDVRALDVDFLAFSLHKMCGPRGVGVLYGKKELLGKASDAWESGIGIIEPIILGGGTVEDTTYDSYHLLDEPERFEAGIQNYAGLIAGGAVIDYLQDIGMDLISQSVRDLNSYLTQQFLQKFGELEWIKIIGPVNSYDRGGILTFEVRRPNAVGIASELDLKNNIMIRDGVFCVNSFFNDRFGLNWRHPKSYRDHRMIYRVSLYFYNTVGDCDIFLQTLEEIFQERSYI